jgi:hypothetical protein
MREMSVTEQRYKRAGWHEANFQAPSFTEFMAQPESGDEFNWQSGYE